MDVNWLGTVMACQVFAVNMVGRDGCSIINITSMATYDALSMVPAYASSKAAVDMFTKWLSNYLSNTAGKVRVNAVAPGYFLTPLNHDMYVNPDGSYTQRYWNVIHRTPMGLWRPGRNWWVHCGSLLIRKCLATSQARSLPWMADSCPARVSEALERGT